MDRDGRITYKVNRQGRYVDSENTSYDAIQIVNRKGEMIRESGHYISGTITRLSEDDPTCAAYQINGDVAGLELFKLMADHINFWEWSLVQTDYRETPRGEIVGQFNFLTTSYNGRTDKAMNALWDARLYSAAYTLRTWTHSHPDGDGMYWLSGLEAGFDASREWKEARKWGDVAHMEWLKEIYGDNMPDLYIYAGGEFLQYGGRMEGTLHGPNGEELKGYWTWNGTYWEISDDAAPYAGK